MCAGTCGCELRRELEQERLYWEDYLSIVKDGGAHSVGTNRDWYEGRVSEVERILAWFKNKAEGCHAAR